VPTVADERDQYRLVLDFYRDGFIDLAESSARDFISTYPDSIYKREVTYHLAMCLVAKKVYSEALTWFTRLADDKSWKRYSDVCYFGALSSQATGNNELAAQWTARALKVVEKPARVEKLHYFSIVNAAALGQNERALSEALEYFETPGWNRYRLEIETILINHFIKTRDYRNAVQVAEIMLSEKQLDKNNESIVQYNYLLSLRELKRYDKADKWFKSLSVDPGYQVILLMADIYTDQEKFPESAALLEKAWTDSRDEIVLLNLAKVMLSWQGPGKALAVMERAGGKKIDPEFMADLYYRTGNLLSCYSLLSSMDVESLTAESLLLLFASSVELEKWKTISAMYTVREKFKVLPDDRRVNMLYVLGETLYNRRERARAETVFKEWLAEFTGDDRIDKVLFMLGTVQKELGRRQSAVVTFTRIQKMRRKDDLYYESFVEKGELLFALYEYHAAIEQYKVYLSGQKQGARRREVMLQAGNASYNIRKYDDASYYYSMYSREYGNSDFIDRKIGNTLLRQEKYKDVQKRFSGREKTSDYIAYLLVYSSYKEEAYVEAVKQSRLRNLPVTSDYYWDVLYLTIYCLNELQQYQDIIKEYSELSRKGTLSNSSGFKPEILKKRQSINELFFMVLVKMGELELAESVFKSSESIDILVYQATVFYRNLYFNKAHSWFMRAVNIAGLDKIERSVLFLIIENSLFRDDFDTAGRVVDFLIEREGTSVSLVVKKVELLSRSGNSEGLAAFSKKLVNNDMARWVTLHYNYALKGSVSDFRRGLSSLVEGRDIEKSLTQAVMLDFIRLEYRQGRYKEVLKLLAKIPDSVLNRVSAEFKYLEARSLQKIGKESKALAEYLKIYYLFSFDTYWVEKSIQNVLEIYADGGETDKYNKTRKMFETKYFIMHD
jgi:TolA-binding protein